MIKISYFVHGTTTDNEKELATGWLPGELSELGQKQSIALGKIVGAMEFDAVFSSDLGRAVISADISFGDRMQVIHDPRLREANYGDWNGGPHSFKDNLADFEIKPFPNGESLRDVEQRIRDFCDYLQQNFNGKHVAILAHQAPQLALEVILNAKTWQQAITEDWRNTKAYQPGWNYEIK